MSKLIEYSRYLSLIAVVVLLLTFAAALGWGAVKAVGVWALILGTQGEASAINLGLVQLVDSFLIAIVLFLFAVNIHELFIGDLALPEWMVVHNLDELKGRMSSLLVLVMAVRFLEHLLQEDTQALDLLLVAASTGIVAGVLIAFAYFVVRPGSTAPSRPKAPAASEPDGPSA